MMTESSNEITLQSVREALPRIAPWIRTTPCIFSQPLSDLSGSQCWIKLENWQTTRSFKIRGAANKILRLASSDSHRPLILASTGNHGAACAHLAAALGKRAICCVPESITKAKSDALKGSGMELRICGADTVEAEAEARELAHETGGHWISPYNDIDIIAGQGTVALEIFQQCPHVSAVLAPVGGGGLMSGVALTAKSINPGLITMGCQPAASPVMMRSIAAGHIVTMPLQPTLSDGTAGGIEPGSLTLELCRRHVDEWAEAEEYEIARAVALLAKHHQLMVEGAAALPLAVLIKNRNQFRGKPVVLVLTGARINIETFRQILNGELSNDQNLHTGTD